MKHAELYELRNSRLVNITGEVHVRTTMTGQDYKIIAIHPNRTVVFTSDYDFQVIILQTLIIKKKSILYFNL